LLLELKDKVSNFSLSHTGTSLQSNWRVQVEAALLGLGFTARDTDSAISEVADEFGSSANSTDISTLLRAALKTQGRQ
jgi:Holliday junction DNA helicase RuvA